jgi:hypothetical protein
MTTLVLEIVLLLLTRLSFSQILWVSLVVTAISYLLGDLVILQASNNLIATIADIGLSVVVIYMFNFFWNRNDISMLSALVAGVVLGLEEAVFHKIIKREPDDDPIDKDLD